MAGKCENVVMVRHDNNSNLKLIPVECGAKGLGIKLSKSSWDPYPFISKIDDESSAMRQGVQIGDCLLQVRKLFLLGLKIFLHDIEFEKKKQKPEIKQREKKNIYITNSRSMDTMSWGYEYKKSLNKFMENQHLTTTSMKSKSIYFYGVRAVCK